MKRCCANFRHSGRFEKLLAGDRLLWGTGDSVRLTEALLARMPRSTGTRPPLYGAWLCASGKRGVRAGGKHVPLRHGAERVYVGAVRGISRLTMCCPACTSARSRRFTLRR